jgi:hypothetical protein
MLTSYSLPLSDTSSAEASVIPSPALPATDSAAAGNNKYITLDDKSLTLIFYLESGSHETEIFTPGRGSD